jgi:hypothetical protein
VRLLSAQEDQYFGSCETFKHDLRNAATASKLGPAAELALPELMKLMSPSQQANLASTWENCFQNQRHLIISFQQNSANHLLSYAAETQPDVQTAVQTSFDFTKGYEGIRSFLFEQYDTVFRGAERGRFLNALSCRSPNSASLIDKSKKIAAFQNASETVSAHFNSPVSPRRIQELISHLIVMYPFSFVISTDGKSLDLKEQLAPLVTCSIPNEGTINALNGPGSSVLFSDALREAKDPLVVALSQQSLYSGDLALLAVDSVFDSFQAELEKTTKTDPTAEQQRNDTYTRVLSLLKGNPLLAMNFITFRLFRTAVWDAVNSSIKDRVLSEYEMAYDSGDSRIMQTWLDGKNVFTHEMMDTSSVTMTCWEELEMERKVQAATAAMHEIDEAFKLGKVRDKTNIDLKQLQLMNLKNQITELGAQMRKMSFACKPTKQKAGFKWYLALPNSDFSIPMPTPTELQDGGILHSSIVYNNLVQAFVQLNDILADVSAPTMISKETLERIEDPLYAAVIAQ